MEPIKMLSKRDILKATELKQKVVDVSEWGGSVIVQEMTANDRDTFDQWVTREEDKAGKGMRVMLVCLTVVDKEGKRMFNDIDIPDLLKKSGNAVSKISEAALEVCGMTEGAKESDKKNLEPDLKEDSPSDSAES